MANKNVVKMAPKVSSAVKADSFLTKHKVAFFVGLCTICVALIAFIVIVNVVGKVKADGLTKVEQIEYLLTKNAAENEGSDLTSVYDSSLAKLESYTKKGGIVGARANMLAAEIYGLKNDFAKARDAWETASSKTKGTYLVSLCKFQAAVCSEELNDTASALKFYEDAANDAEFVDKTHALFSIGRINEANANYSAAMDAYNKIANMGLKGDVWADLAKTRTIQLEIEGKSE